MKIDSLRICGFKCFNNEQVLKLEDLTCLIGSNGLGKTAALEALCRLFGETRDLRSVKNSDFFVEQGKSLNDYENRNFYIEARITFPEILKSQNLDEIPMILRYLTINDKNEIYARIRLTAEWTNNNTPDGLIKSELNWIKTDREDFAEDDVEKVKNEERDTIRVYYIPAIRTPENQIKNITGTIIKQLFNSIDWEDGSLISTLENNTTNINNAFQEKESIKVIQETLTNYWKEYTSDKKHNKIMLAPVEIRMDLILRNIKTYFLDSSENQIEDLEYLSEGQKSLFYLSLINTLFKIENDVDNGFCSCFSKELLIKPYLSIFAIEEPENHLAPHYLGRIISIFRELTKTKTQTLLTSHSSSIVKRIGTNEIRYFMQNDKSETIIKSIHLPLDTVKEDKHISLDTVKEYKFVKEAVQSYPELYFSKIVVFGEGDSEAYVIPKLANYYNIKLDKSFVSFVPLAGRFVNHYWKLLNDLDIKYITLLDLDFGRNTGGPDKIKYIKEQLQENSLLNPKEIKYLEDEKVNIVQKINFLKTKNIYFSEPIDLDFLMLVNYFDYYSILLPGEKGPDIPDPSVPIDEKNERDINAVARVLKKERKEDKAVIDLNKLPYDIKFYYWYRYLFLSSKGKPAAHMNAFTNMNKEIILKQKVLSDFFDKLQKMMDE